MRRRVNELMLTQPNWEPFLRSELLTSPDLFTKNVMAFRSPIEAMHNMAIRAQDGVVNKVPGAAKQLIGVNAAIMAGLLSYRAIKTVYYESLTAVPQALGFGLSPDDDDEEKKALFEDVPEQLMLDALNVSPAGKLLIPIVQNIIKGWRAEFKGRNAVESTPIFQLADLMTEISHLSGTIARKKSEGDPSWPKDRKEMIILLTQLVSIAPGAPVNAPIRVIEPWLPKDTKLEAAINKMDMAIFRSTKKATSDRQKVFERKE